MARFIIAFHRYKILYHTHRRKSRGYFDFLQYSRHFRARPAHSARCAPFRGAKYGELFLKRTVEDAGPYKRRYRRNGFLLAKQIAEYRCVKSKKASLCTREPIKQCHLCNQSLSPWERWRRSRRRGGAEAIGTIPHPLRGSSLYTREPPEKSVLPFGRYSTHRLTSTEPPVKRVVLQMRAKPSAPRDA